MILYFIASENHFIFNRHLLRRIALLNSQSTF